MGKNRSHKRQRFEKPQPLGSASIALDDSTKDDEERRLESLLFGTQHTPRSRNDANILVISDDEGDERAVEGGNELQTILDSELFFVDDAGPSHIKPDIEIDISEPPSETENEPSVHDSEDEQQGDNSSEDSEATGDERPPISFKSQKAPAWADPDDVDVQVSLGTSNRLRKLREAPDDDTVGGREYERRLRRQYEAINPTPEWARKARKGLRSTKQKRRRSSASSEDDSVNEEEDSEYPGLLASTGGVLSQTKARALPQGTLSIERLRDANISARSEGAVKTVQFHPSLPVLLATGEDRRLRLFNIDGHSNPLLQTIHIPSLPLSTAYFHPSGSHILLAGPRPFYYTYDLQSGTAQKSPRGLWGTTFSGSTIQESCVENCAFDPTGEVLAVAGKRGYVHLVDWKSGAGQVVGSVKMNASVKGLWWRKTESGGGTPELMSLGENAEVYVWDVGQRRCVRKWKDEGGFGSQIIGGDPSGRYLGIGSRHGLVNLYDGNSMAPSDKPKFLKTVHNLTTSITSLRFNHDSQLVAIASKTKKDQMRMVHLPSLTVFSNWPTSGTPLGHVTSTDFSAGSEYIAVGNTRGRVLLYHLRDFSSHS